MKGEEKVSNMTDCPKTLFGAFTKARKTQKLTRLISNWLEEIATRKRVRDWEGDTMYGGIVKTRRPEETKSKMIKALVGKEVNSISLNNGSEFSLFPELEKEVNAPVFFPKGCDFLTVSDGEVQAVVDLLNNSPHKCLGWETPFEVFHSQSVALT